MKEGIITFLDAVSLSCNRIASAVALDEIHLFSAAVQFDTKIMRFLDEECI